MKFHNMDNWIDGFRHDGLLYFTHRIQEMLFYYTDNMYKTPVLNTYMLIKEYIETVKLVKEKTINDQHLRYIMDEFKDTMKTDIILIDRYGEDGVKKFLQRIETTSPVDQEKVMMYFHQLFYPYNLWCKEYLKKTVPNEREKKKIERALKCFIPGLLGAGYSHEFIYFFNRKVFFKSPVSSIEALDTFLDRFDYREKEYDVYVPVAKEAFKFRGILEKRMHVEFDFDAGIVDLKYDSEKYGIIKLTIEAYDERSAANLAFDRLDLFFRFYDFIGDKRNTWMYNRSKVIDRKGNSAFVDLWNDGFDYSYRFRRQSLENISEGLITSLVTYAPKSFLVIDRAIKIHNIAISETDLSNGFLNLWSIFEILFVTEKNENKINEIEKKVLPILQKDYIHGLIEFLEDYITENVKKKDIDIFLKDNGLENDEHWLAKITFIESYKSVREKLYIVLADYPIIRSRISQFAEHYSHMDGMLKDVERYSQRIMWHFKRLYRTRNAIVHSGEIPLHLKELGEHLHSYVDDCMFEIALTLANKRYLQTIDNVVLDVQIRGDDIMNYLRKKGDVTEDTIKFLFE